MEVTELECYKLSKNFNTYSSEICSSDNDFAVAIKNGVHVLSIVPNLTSDEESFDVRRSIIRTPTDFPFTDVTLDVHTLNREKFCLLQMNSKYTPLLEKSVPASVYVKQIGFAEIQHSLLLTKSIIGILTNQGCLQLFLKRRYDWFKVADISSLWKDYCLSAWFTTQTENNFENLKIKFSYIYIVSFVCCEEFRVGDENVKSWLLACISKNGIMSLWKIDQNVIRNVPTLINTVDLEILVHSLYWHPMGEDNGWIIASCVDGTVKIYSCKKTKSNQIEVNLQHEIWKDADQVLPSYIKVKKQHDRLLLTFSKQNFVLLFSILNKEIVTYTCEFGKKVIGLEIIDDFSVFVCLTNNEMYNLLIKDKKYDCVPITFKTTTNIKNHGSWGITFSKNKILCAISMNIIRNFDHLIIKEPWQIMLCSTKKEVTLPSLQSLINTVSLYDLYDYLEYFRLCCIKNKKSINEDILNSLWGNLNEDISVCRKNVQIVYISLQCCRSNQNPKDLYVLEILFYICNFLYYISKLSDIRKQYYFYQWLSSNLSKLPKFLLEYKQLKDVSEIMNKYMDYNAEEKCDVCLNGICNHSNTKYVVCEKGHQILRCSFSFLPIGTQPSAECAICHSLFLYSEDIRRCVVCDNKM